MLLVVPPLDEEPWPTLGSQLCDFIEERVVYGPGSLQGQPYEIDDEFRAWLFRTYELFPRGHPWEGRRRFKRAGMSVRKGLAKTEKMGVVAYCELHPEGPTRFDGWGADGEPVGRPVVSPYIPMLAVSVEQVEELGFGALKYMVEEGPDADLFDSGLDRILRLDHRGRPDGKAVPLANSPGARDGARTTLNCFDEPHRLTLPRQIDAHTTMDANLPKRPLDDPWSLYVGTAGALGAGSVAESLHEEAELIAQGKVERPDLFYLYRTASDRYDMKVKAERIEAVREATGPAGEWGPGQFDEIASKWDRPNADRAFLERVWLNRWVASEDSAFDVVAWEQESRARPKLKRRSLVVAGFDGARFRDATGIVLTDVETGQQQRWGLWERPPDVDEWEVDEDEVSESVKQMMRDFQVWRFYCDPPHWTSTIGDWQQKWPDVVKEFWTAKKTQMAWAVRAYAEAISTGAVTHDGDEDFARHIANAGRRELELYDDEGKKLFLLRKLHVDRKFDLAMAGCLSWRAYLDAQAKGVKRVKRRAPRQIR